MNLEKLQKLRDHIDQNVPPNHFDMTMYNSKLTHKEQFFNGNHCCTQGCIIGHSVVLDMKLLEAVTEDNDSPYVEYTLWSEKYLEIESTDPVWHYLFSEFWGSLAPSKASALERIDYVLQHDGEIPTLKALRISYPHYDDVFGLFNEEADSDEIEEEQTEIEILSEMLERHSLHSCRIHTCQSPNNIINKYGITAGDGTRSPELGFRSMLNFIEGFAMRDKISKEWT